MKKLPDKLHELLSLAIKDMEILSKNPKVKFNMGNWVKVDDKYCEVCLAGSVMFNTLKIRKTNSPSSLGRDMAYKMCAIDEMRGGWFIDAKKALLDYDPDIKIKEEDREKLKKLDELFSTDYEYELIKGNNISDRPQQNLHFYKKYRDKLKEMNL